MSKKKINSEFAAMIKSKGGVSMDCLQDFAIFGQYSYSFDLVARFTQKKIAEVNLKKGTKLSPGKVILNYIVKKLLLEKEFKQLVIVFHGNMVESFAHAACFIY